MPKLILLKVNDWIGIKLPKLYKIHKDGHDGITKKKLQINRFVAMVIPAFFWAEKAGIQGI